MKKHFPIYSFFLLTFLVSCKPQAGELPLYQEEKIKRKFITPVKKMLDAHGGYENWLNFRLLSFHLNKDQNDSFREIHTIDLQNRRVHILSREYELGFDGEDIWVAPDLSSFPDNSPRFYYNLYFYFHSLPFLVADPGVIYEDFGLININNKQYHKLSITYQAGVGDSSKDEYLLFLDAESYQLSWILYTVTYYTGEKSTSYYAIKYEDWVNVEGLILPTSLTGYNYENGKIKEKRHSAHFSDIHLYDALPDIDPFVRPEVSEVDSSGK